MSRLRADFLLLVTAVIWGTAFIAQKTGMNGLGPFGFIGARFTLSWLVILPLALRERRVKGPLERRYIALLAAVCFVFFGGALFQQTGLLTTSVTNAGFLTGLYVVLVPFVAWFLFRKKPRTAIWPACLLALAGIWFLNGGKLARFTDGDWLVLGSAVFYALHIALVGLVIQKTQRPLTIVLWQYAACALLGLAGFMLWEEGNMAALRANIWPVAYAGLISGGIAYTLQVIAQGHTPPSDAAIILSAEALFAALAGAVLLGERLDAAGWLGCMLILGAILLMEAGSFLISGKGRFTVRLKAEKNYDS